MDRPSSKFSLMDTRAGPPPARFQQGNWSKPSSFPGSNDDGASGRTKRPPPPQKSRRNRRQGIPEKSNSGRMPEDRFRKRSFVDDTPAPRMPPNNQQNWRQDGFFPPQPPPPRASWWDSTYDREITTPHTSQHDAFYSAANNQRIPHTSNYSNVPFHPNHSPLQDFNRRKHDSSNPQFNGNFNNDNCHQSSYNNNNSTSWRLPPSYEPLSTYHPLPEYRCYDRSGLDKPSVSSNANYSTQCSSWYSPNANVDISNQGPLSAAARQHDINWTARPEHNRGYDHVHFDRGNNRYAPIRKENFLPRTKFAAKAQWYPDKPRINASQQRYSGRPSPGAQVSSSSAADKSESLEATESNQPPSSELGCPTDHGSHPVGEKSSDLEAKNSSDQLSERESGEIDENSTRSLEDMSESAGAKQAYDQLPVKATSDVNGTVPPSPAGSSYSSASRISKYGDLRIPVPKKNFITVATKVVWLRGLPADCSQAKLKQIMAPHGCVENVVICDDAQSSALITMSTRKDTVHFIHEIGREFFIGEKRVKVCYGKGKGVSKHNNKDHWDGSRGITYLPFECLPTDLSGLVNESYLDIDSLPFSKKNYYNSDGTFKESPSTSSVNDTGYAPYSGNDDAGSTSYALQQSAIMYNFESQLEGNTSSEDEPFIFIP